MQQLARIGSWRRSLPDGELWWSDEIYRIFGIDPAGGPPSLDLLFSRVHPDDRETFKAQVASHEPHRSDYRIVLPDGAVKHIHEEVSVERDEQGTPVRIYGTAQDVTERRRAEEALRKSERMLQAIFDAEPECVKLLDEDASLILMNRAGLDMLEADSPRPGQGPVRLPAGHLRVPAGVPGPDQAGLPGRVGRSCCSRWSA